MFFISLINAATLVYDGDLGPSPESLISSYDAALQALAQNVDTQPLPVDLSAELTKQIEAAGLANYATGLLSQIAEMQKQLDALNLLPPPTQGTVIAVTGTAPVVSTGGISPNISMAAANTSTDGYLTSTDWNTFNNKAPATSGASILYGNGSGGFSNVSTGSGVSFVAGVLSATGSGGTITSVTATAPIASSGGFTPNISINAAYGDTVNPYAAKTANYVLAGPTSGAAAAPTFRALVAADIPSLSYVTSVTGTSPVVSSGGTTPAISMPAASASVNGYLTSADWTTFNGKQPAGTYVTSVTGTAPVVSSGGTTPAISMAAASTSVSGYLTSTDWNTFNGKGSGTVTSVTGTAPVVSSGGATPAISMAAASASANGYLTSTDWSTFNNKGSGTVTTVSVVSANGFAGTVATATTTPAITLTTSITGLLYGNGTALAAASVSAPLAYSAGTLSITQSTTSTNGYLSSTDWNTFNNKQAVSAPVTKTADFTVAATDLWLVNNKSGSTCTTTLPTASSYSGRVLHFQNYQAQAVVSASSNVVPLAGGAAATSILLASTGDSATLVSDGSNWLITQYVPNNILLLE
jgi:hypothetical protein